MNLECLTLKGFKGVDATMMVGKLNLLVGPNGSGKTARLLAQTWAITGQTALGGRAEDTAKLAGTQGCSVVMATDEKFDWMRTLSIDHRTKKLSTSVSIAGEEILGVTEADARVRAAVGDYAPMFDVTKFLDLSAEGKRAEVLRLCAGSHAMSIDASSSLADRVLAEWLKQELGEGTVALVVEQQGMSNGLQTLLEKAGEARQHVVRAVMKAITESTDTAEQINTIAASLDTAKAMMNAAKRQRDESQQAGRKLSEQKATVEVPAEVVELLTGRRDALLEKRTELVGQMENQRGRESARTSLTDSLDDAGLKMETAEKRLAAAKSVEAVPLCEAKGCESAAAQIDVEEVDAQPAVDKAIGARSAVRQAEDELFGAERELDQAAHKKATIAQRLDEARQSPWQQALVLSTVIDEAFAGQILDDSNEGKPLDELGQQVNANWHTLFNLIVNYANDASIKELEEQSAATSKRLIALTAAIDKLKQTAVDAEAEYKLSEEGVAKARIHEQAARANRVRRDELLAQAKTIREAFNARAREIAYADDATTDLQEHRVSLERRLNELDAQGGHMSLDDLGAQHLAIERELVDVQSKVKAKQRYQTLEAEFTSCIASAEREGTMHDVCKGLCEAIRKVRETIMGEVVAPLIRRMNDCLGRMGVPAGGVYCDLVNPRGKPIFELGWIVDQPPAESRKVSIEAMSGGETVLFSTCLLLALIELADPPLKLLLIEAGAVDRERLPKLLRAIESVQDRFSNAFVETHLDPPLVETRDWNVVHVGAAEAVETTA